MGILNISNKNFFWDDLSRFGKNKFFRTSYYWLAIIPILVNFFERLEKTIVLRFAQAKFEFNLDLPFSWKLFYIGALFVTIGNLIYEIFCPEINKKFKDYTEFKNKGYTYSYFLKYSNQLSTSLKKKLDLLQLKFESGNTKTLVDDEGPYTSEMFWELFNLAKRHKIEARFLCGVTYAMGLAIILIVFIQNVFSVIRYIF